MFFFKSFKVFYYIYIYIYIICVFIAFFLHEINYNNYVGCVSNCKYSPEVFLVLTRGQYIYKLYNLDIFILLFMIWYNNVLLKT